MSWLSQTTINGQSVASLGVSNVRITYRSLAADVCEITGTRDLPEGMLTGTVTVAIGSATFSGRVDGAATNQQGGSGTTIAVTLAGKWQDLEHTIYTQPSLFGDGASEGVHDTRVLIAGEWEEVDPEEDGVPAADARDRWRAKPLTAQAALQALCSAAGISLSGSLPSQLIPPISAENISIAEAIRSLFRWFPGASASFNGSASMLTVRTTDDPYDYSNLPLEAISENLHYRTVPEGVRIVFRKRRGSQLRTRLDLIEDEAGNLGDLSRVLQTGIDLAPSVRSVEVASVWLANTSQIESPAFWRRSDPLLQQRYKSDDYDFDAHENPTQVAKESDVEGAPEYQFYVRAGSIPADWGSADRMVEIVDSPRPMSSANDVGFQSAPGTATAVFTFDFAQDGLTRFYQSSVNVTFLEGEDLQSGKLYLAWEDKSKFDPGEDPEDFNGIAAQVLNAAQSSIGLSGEVVLRPPTALQSLIGRTLSAGSSLGRIYEQSVDAFLGQTVLHTGYPAFLGPSDLVELARGIRALPRVKKATLEGDGSESVEDPGFGPGNDAEDELGEPSPQIRPPTAGPAAEVPEEDEIASARTPFFVKVTPVAGENESDPTTFRATVLPGRIYYDSLSQANVEIVGLNAPPISVLAGTYVVLNISINSSRQVTGAEVSFESAAPNAIEISGDIQTGAHRIIAVIIEEGDRLIADQRINSDILLATRCYGGFGPALIPTAF